MGNNTHARDGETLSDATLANAVRDIRNGNHPEVADALLSGVAALRTELALRDGMIDSLRAELAAYDDIFAWLLGERDEFPESLPGRRYGFRSELRERLNTVRASGEDAR